MSTSSTWKEELDEIVAKKKRDIKRREKDIKRKKVIIVFFILAVGIAMMVGGDALGDYAYANFWSVNWDLLSGISQVLFTIGFLISLMPAVIIGTWCLRFIYRWFLYLVD